MSGVAIHPETPDLSSAIRAVLLQAFPSPVEADLVDRLRADGDIEIGLAAIDGQDVIGHVVVLSHDRARQSAWPWAGRRRDGTAKGRGSEAC